MYSLSYSTENAHDDSIWCCTWGYANQIIDDKNITEEETVSSTTTEEYIVTASLDDTLKIWVVGGESLKLHKKFEGESLGLVAIALNDDCTFCATTSIDSNLVYWDLISGTRINEINTGPVELWSVAFAPDNKHVITGGQSGKINMFTVPGGVHQQTYDTNGKFALSIAFSPDGKHIACGRVDGIINIFDVESAKLTHTLEGHALPVRTLCFSPDSEYLVTGSDDGHMKVYAIRHSEIVGAVSGHSSWVLSVSYSPSGNYFVSSSSDRCIKIWKATDLKCVQILKEHTDQTEMATKWGIVSAGRVAHDFVAALDSLPRSDHKVVAVAARDVQRAKEFAKKFDIPKTYESYETLADDVEIDVFYVGVINPYHYGVTKLLIDRGKNVLCEKPLCMKPEQVKELTELAREKKVFLMEAAWSRFFPLYDYIRKTLKDGKIGQVRHVTVTLGIKNFTIPRISQPDLGGGVVLDLGVYTLQLVTMICGSKMPIEVHALGSLSDQGVDQYATYILKYEDGKLATGTISTQCLMTNEAYIYGTDGYIKVCDPFWKPTKIIVNDKTHEVSLPKSKHKFYINNSVGLSYEAEHVRKCLKTGQTECSLMTHEDSLTLSLLEQRILKELGVNVAQC